MKFGESDVDVLLSYWPRLRRAPVTRDGFVSIVGTLGFSMAPAGLPLIEDSYTIRLEVPTMTSANAPQVFETGGRITRHIDNHVYTNGALCLGSPWMLRRIIGTPPDLLTFVNQCVVPFLYSASCRERNGGDLPFSELAHGKAGLLDDYEQILGLRGANAVSLALRAISQRHRVANKNACPCGCGRRLGACDFRWKLARRRSDGSRAFFRSMGNHFRMA